MSNQKPKITVRTITAAAAAAALVFVVTWLIMLPVPGVQGAYMNLGDVVIYMTAFLFGGPVAGVSAAAGSMLADLALGSSLYAPATFVIKGAMGLIAALIMGKARRPLHFVLACAACGLIMVGCYAVYESFLYGWKTALISVPFNLIQAAFGMLASVFYLPLKRLRSYFQKLYS